MVGKSRHRGVRGEGLSGLEGLLAVVGLQVTMNGFRTGTGTERWRERIPDFRGRYSLPDDLRAQQDYESFRQGLKTWLFSRY